MSAVVSPAETHTEGEEHKSRSYGWYGMVFFLASEAIFFANLIASYLYLRIRATGLGEPWPPHGATLETGLIAINTVILLSSSFPMHFAARAISKGNKRALTINLLSDRHPGQHFPQHSGVGIYPFRLHAEHGCLWLDLLHIDRVPRRARDRWCAVPAGLFLPLTARRFHQRPPLRCLCR